MARLKARGSAGIDPRQAVIDFADRVEGLLKVLPYQFKGLSDELMIGIGEGLSLAIHTVQAARREFVRDLAPRKRGKS